MLGLMTRLACGRASGDALPAAAAAAVGMAVARRELSSRVEAANSSRSSGMFAAFTNPEEKDAIAVVMTRGEGVYVYDS